MSLLSAFDFISFQLRRSSSVEGNAKDAQPASTTMGKKAPIVGGGHVEQSLHSIIMDRSIKELAVQMKMTEDAAKKWRVYGVPQSLVRLFRWMVIDDVVWSEALRLRQLVDADALAVSIAQKRVELDRLEHQRQGMMDAADCGRGIVVGLPTIGGKIGRTV